MVNYWEILRLYSLKYTQRQVVASVHCSRNTVSDVIKLASKVGLSSPLDDFYTNEMLLRYSIQIVWKQLIPEASRIL